MLEMLPLSIPLNRTGGDRRRLLAHVVLAPLDDRNTGLLETIELVHKLPLVLDRANDEVRMRAVRFAVRDRGGNRRMSDLNGVVWTGEVSATDDVHVPVRRLRSDRRVALVHLGHDRTPVEDVAVAGEADGKGLMSGLGFVIRSA